MPSFYYIVICIAVIFLILILTWLGIMINSSKTIIPFPPNSDNCPDFWVSDTNGCKLPDATTGKNIGSLNKIIKDETSYTAFIDISNTPGLFKANGADPFTAGNKKYVDLITDGAVINFKHPDWTTCKKKRWANNYNITWDGVSNYNSC